MQDKRLGYLLMRMRNRYKDETLDLKWAGGKVRKLIDKYLESMGINPKIPPVKLLSEDFPKSIETHNKSGKAKASEMEHAIRWHIKINMDKDPALYTKFSERLQKILDAHKDHWDVIADELTKLRDDIGKGRGPAPSPTSPFFDLLILESGITDKQSNDYELSGKIAEVIYSKIKEFISIPNCWQKPSERKQLERSIRIERDGSLSVLVPEKTSDHEVEAILKSNE